MYSAFLNSLVLESPLKDDRFHCSSIHCCRVRQFAKMNLFYSGPVRRGRDDLRCNQLLYSIYSFLCSTGAGPTLFRLNLDRLILLNVWTVSCFNYFSKVNKVSKGESSDTLAGHAVLLLSLVFYFNIVFVAAAYISFNINSSSGTSIALNSGTGLPSYLLYILASAPTKPAL